MSSFQVRSGGLLDLPAWVPAWLVIVLAMAPAIVTVGSTLIVNKIKHGEFRPEWWRDTPDHKTREEIMTASGASPTWRST